VLNFDSGGSSLLPAQSATPEKYSTNIPAPLRQQLEEQLGGADTLQEVTDRVLDASASALAQSHALEVLARNFPPQTEARLMARDGEILRGLQDKHVSELGRLVMRIRAEVKPLLSLPSNSPVPQATDNGTRTWQAGVPSLVASAHETDRLLNRLLAGSYSQSLGEEMLSRLAAQIEQFDWTIQSQRQARR
jgi:hypothetical protein